MTDLLPVSQSQAQTEALRFRTQFAWEFLRRNPRYRRVAQTVGAIDHQEEAAARPFGLRFLADPSVGPTAMVYWRPEAAPSNVLVLEPAGPGVAGGVDLVAGAVDRRRGADGWHVQFGGGLQGWVCAADLSQPLAAVLPICGSFTAALQAASDLERRLRGQPVRSDLTLQQRMRLTRILNAVDARAARASYRDIALILFGQEAVDRHPWRTSSVRNAVIRHVRSGRALVAGGYRSLLLNAAALRE